MKVKENSTVHLHLNPSPQPSAPQRLCARYPTAIFRLKEQTATKKAVYLTYVTTEGLKRNAYANDVQSEVTLDSLFRE